MGGTFDLFGKIKGTARQRYGDLNVITWSEWTFTHLEVWGMRQLDQHRVCIIMFTFNLLCVTTHHIIAFAKLVGVYLHNIYILLLQWSSHLHFYLPVFFFFL